MATNTSDASMAVRGRLRRGPQGGGAYNAAKGWIEATTGLVAGEDYDAIKANWATGFQSFMDGKVEMYVNGCIDPCQQFIQFTETETVRFIGPEDDQGEALMYEQQEQAAAPPAAAGDGGGGPRIMCEE